MQLVATLALSLMLRAAPDASVPARPSVEAELEAQLAATTQPLPPAEVLVVVEGPDPKRYRLEEATLRLDSVAVVAVSAAAAAAAGKPPAGTQVSDGEHVFSGQLVYRGQALGPHPWEEGPKWTLPARVSIQASRGLRLTIRLTVEVNDRAPMPAQRLSLHSELEPQMLVVVDDAPLPPPPLPDLPAPPVPSPAPVSSPPPRAAAAPAKTSPPKKKQPKKKARAAPAATAAAAAPGKAAPDTTESLDQATARLRAALSAPHDAGTPAGAGAPR